MTYESDGETIETRLSGIETSLRLDQDELAEIDPDLTHGQQLELLIAKQFDSVSRINNSGETYSPPSHYAVFAIGVIYTDWWG